MSFEHVSDFTADLIDSLKSNYIKTYNLLFTDKPLYLLTLVEIVQGLIKGVTLIRNSEANLFSNYFSYVLEQTNNLLRIAKSIGQLTLEHQKISKELKCFQSSSEENEDVILNWSVDQVNNVPESDITQVKDLHQQIKVVLQSNKTNLIQIKLAKTKLSEIVDKQLDLASRGNIINSENLKRFVKKIRELIASSNHVRVAHAKIRILETRKHYIEARLKTVRLCIKDLSQTLTKLPYSDHTDELIEA